MQKLVFIAFILLSCSTQMIKTTPDGQMYRVCKSEEPVVYAFKDDKFLNNKFQQTVEDAFEYWNWALNKKVFVRGDFYNDLPRVAIKIVDWRDLGSRKSLDGQNIKIAGETWRYGLKNGCLLVAEIKINSLYISDLPQLETIMRHEIGHVIGFNDTPEYGSVMYKSVDDDNIHPVEFSVKEMEAIKRLRE